MSTKKQTENTDATEVGSPTSAAATSLSLKRCRRTMIVEMLTPDRLQQAFQLVCDAALRADNVGLDEYPTINHFEKLVRRSKAAVGLRSMDDGSLDGVIVVSPCTYARSCRPTLCTLVVMTSTSVSTTDAWRDVVDVAMDTARRLPEMYSACVMNVFVTCISRILALREAGFMITACIPYTGKLAGFHDYVSNYIMFTDLGNVPRPPTFVEAYSEPLCPRMVDIPWLPVTHTLCDGTSVTIRSMRRDEVLHFWDALKSAAESGVGYGFDEVYDLDVFMRYYVDGFCNCVIELTQTGEVVSYFNGYGPCQLARTADPVIKDGGNMILKPKYRGRGWYSELSRILHKTADKSIDSKIRGMQSDTAVVNLPVNLVIMYMNYKVNGILPRSIYFKEHGWVDMVLCFRPYRSYDEQLSKL